MPTQTSQSGPWWGPQDVPRGTTSRWVVGPLTLRVQRLEHEWRIAHEQGPDPTTSDRDHDNTREPVPLLDALNVVRHADSGQRTGLELRPGGPDRPVVTHPEKPLSIPGQRITTIYVSTPAWMQVVVGDTPILDVPTFRLSDTWFGATTREGEICYAVRTFCRLRLEDLPRRPHRTITTVHLDNRQDAPMLLDRFKLPLHSLPLLADPAHHLWTPDINITLAMESDLDVVEVQPAHPSHEQVAAARIVGTRFVTRVMSTIRRRGSKSVPAGSPELREDA